MGSLVGAEGSGSKKAPLLKYTFVSSVTAEHLAALLEGEQFASKVVELMSISIVHNLQEIQQPQDTAMTFI